MVSLRSITSMGETYLIGESYGEGGEVCLDQDEQEKMEIVMP